MFEITSILQLFQKLTPPEMLFQKCAAYLQSNYFEEQIWLISSEISVFLKLVLLFFLSNGLVVKALYSQPRSSRFKTTG